MNLIRNEPETLHIGEDFKRAYKISADSEIPTAEGVMKIRNSQGKLLAEADCRYEGNTLYCTIPAERTKSIGRQYANGQYDVFLIVGDTSYKLIMGNIKIIHDVSMH